MISVNSPEEVTSIWAISIKSDVVCFEQILSYEHKIIVNCMSNSKCEHYWPPNGSYFCIHCGADINSITS